MSGRGLIFSFTLTSLQECFDALGEINSLDEIQNGGGERYAAWRLIRLCRTLAADCEEWAGDEQRPTLAKEKL